ncbi:MAG: acyltransferase family protein [Rehaibacterium terrae]|uniref:acyltransferase family protein n=1 Tax=Rehaibacterium terrae TaxID=1341696 RepID=UPI00391AAC3A
MRLRNAILGAPGGRHAHDDALDGLRGLAVLIVLASHLSNAGYDLLPGISLSGIGKSGVYLFFVLSSFLLTRALLAQPPARWRSARHWANYAMRRVLRIWPLYLVVLLLSWALTGLAPAVGWHYRIDTAALIAHIGLWQGQSVLWSIPVEFHYYLWLPLVALLLLPTLHRRHAWAWGLAIAVALTALALAVWPPADSLPNDVRLGPYLSLFIAGAYAALVTVSAPPATSASAGRRWGLVGIVSLIAFLATMPVTWQLWTDGGFQPTLNHRWFPFFGVLWAALLLAVMFGPGWLRSPFAHPLMRTWGVVSFSAYLWHMPLLDWMRAWQPAVPEWLMAWGFLAATLLVSLGSWALFERPWQRVRISNR